LRSGLGQATYTCVPLSPSSITWYGTGQMVVVLRLGSTDKSMVRVWVRGR